MACFNQDMNGFFLASSHKNHMTTNHVCVVCQMYIVLRIGANIITSITILYKRHSRNMATERSNVILRIMFLLFITEVVVSMHIPLKTVNTTVNLTKRYFERVGVGIQTELAKLSTLSKKLSKIFFNRYHVKYTGQVVNV